MAYGNPSSSSLKSRLEGYSRVDKDFWAFRGSGAREHAHAYFQYPAMMVPQMQGELLSAAIQDDSTIKHVYDPFVGSGTALTEAMMQGCDFTGQDINPLAILLCRAKAIPHYCSSLEEKLHSLIAAFQSDRGQRYEVSFHNQRKWFRRDVIIQLSRIRRAIRAEPGLWARRFFWVAMAETVRLTSNARTSTFKLHARPFDEQSSRLLDPFQMFVATCRRNLENLRKQKSLLSEKGFLDRGVYSGSVETMIADTSAPNDATVRQCDLLITSPPYGDNVSTIPYGQHSYLPLQWIDLTDIDRNVDPNFLRSTHEIDHRSLGGSRAIENIDVERLTELSSSYRRVSRLLASEPRDRLARVTAFCRDLEKSLTSILSNLRPGALMIWTVGNRRVANHPIPLDKMLQEFLTARGSTAVCTIARRIPTKRTALRNNIATTMRRETVVVMRNST